MPEEIVSPITPEAPQSETETRHDVENLGERPVRRRWDDARGVSRALNPPMSNETPIDKALRDITVQDSKEGPSYYDLSILKPPVWTPEVSSYFFLGGMSAGSYLIARAAERFGGERYRDVTKLGTYTALATALPCAPLLIIDLGDPKRFHHMLRVFKPASPMNLGSWVLTGFSAVAAGMTLREFVKSRTTVPAGLDSAAAAVGDLAGMPLAVMLGGYTGVLLSTTSTPVWCRNPWIGPIFSAGAVGTGIAGIRLALEVRDLVSSSRNSGSGEQKADTPESQSAERALKTAASAAHVAEGAAIAAFLAQAGDLAKPLTSGKQSKQFLAGAVGAGLVVPELIEHLPIPKKLKPWMKIIALICTLIGGFAMRHAFVSAGKTSADDPDAAREVSSEND